MWPRLSGPPPVERPAPSMRTGSRKPSGVQLLFETHYAPSLEIAPKEGAHDLRMVLDDMQRAVFDPVAQWDHAAHPHPLLL